jgi:hypothetical protein
MFEVKQSQSIRVPIRLVDSSGQGVQLQTYANVTIYVEKRDGTVQQVTLSGPSDFYEVTTGAFATLGKYTLVLGSAYTGVIGPLTIAYTCTGVKPQPIVINVVRNIESDTKTVVDNIRADYTTVRASKIDTIDTINTNISNISTDYTTARATKLDYLPTINTNLNTLRADYTTARAGSIDNIDTVLTLISDLISDYTSARAAKLDNLDATISSTKVPYVSFTGGGETIRPVVSSVSVPRRDQVRILFSEPVRMDTSSNGALNSTNYSIAGLTILSVIQESDSQVLLTTTNQTPAITYNLIITNIQDLNGNVVGGA